MTNLPAVSVIIPMYNASQFVGQCLESLLAQTFTDFEVIIVDDCSTDSSAAIVESYAPKFDGRLALLQLDRNSGSGAVPRNTGLKFARGEYIFFADADDMLTLTALEELFALAERFNADVVYCEKYYAATPDLSEVFIHSEQHGGSFVDRPTLESDDLSERVQKILQDDFWVTPWCKFIRRSLLVDNEISFPPCKIAEDDIWTYELVFCAKKFLRVPNIIYVWRQSEDSMFRRNRSPQREIKFWVNPLVFGLKALDDFMGKLEFFRVNPQFRLAILDHFAHGRCLAQLSKVAAQVEPLKLYETIRDGFSDALGSQNVLFAYLCTLACEQRKNLSLKDEQIQRLLDRL